MNWREGASQARDKYIKGEMTKEEALKIIEVNEYPAKVEHPDRFELNSATAQIEQSNRRN